MPKDFSEASFRIPFRGILIDELFESLTLIQTGRMQRVPFLLFGRAFWEKIINWNALAEAGTIAAEDLDLIHFVETAEEAIAAQDALDNGMITSGAEKMSKSLGNYIAFNHGAKDMFGRIMSVPDATMWVYYDLLLLSTPEELAALKAGHPMGRGVQAAVAHLPIPTKLRQNGHTKRSP